MTELINIQDALNTLIRRNYDAEKGFDQIADKVENSILKESFQQTVQNRYRFGHDIKAIMADLDLEIRKGTSMQGDLHRAWIALKDAVTSQDDELIIEEAIRGEKFAYDDYAAIVLRKDLEEGHRQILRNHLESIKLSIRNLERMKTLIGETA